MSGAGVEVRPARTQDLETIEALEVAVFGRATVAAAVRRAAAPTDPRCFVAVLDGSVRGFLSAVVVADEVEIHDVAVDPDWRRRGLALALVREVLEEAARAGCGRVVLEVGEGNRAARKLYERCGFRSCGVRRGYYRAGAEDARILERSLP